MVTVQFKLPDGDYSHPISNSLRMLYKVGMHYSDSIMVACVDRVERVQQLFPKAYDLHVQNFQLAA